MQLFSRFSVTRSQYVYRWVLIIPTVTVDMHALLIMSVIYKRVINRYSIIFPQALDPIKEAYPQNIILIAWFL